MEGLPRNAFRTPLNVTVLLYYFLPPFWTYVVNKLLVHIIAFGGMYLLLHSQVITGKKQIALGVAFLFSLLPYYHIQYGLSIAGQPLLLWAFWGIARQERRIAHWLVITTFPFYSFFVATLPFFIPFLVCLGAFYVYQTRKLNMPYIATLLLYIFLSILAEFPLLYSSIINPSFVSHRAVWNPFIVNGNPSLVSSLKAIILGTLVTPYHAGSMITLPIGLAIIVSFIYRGRLTFPLVILIACIGIIIIWASLNDWLIMAYMSRVPMLRIFNFDRANFLLPMLWLMLLAILLAQMNWKKPLARTAGIILLAAIFGGVLLQDTEFKNNIKLLAGGHMTEPSYRQFYAEDLFEQIKTVIPGKNHTVVTIGAFPNIALFNGLNTLDGYQNNYDLNYKKKFRKIIAGELAKNDTIANYFDFWGSRCYILSNELKINYLHPKSGSDIIHNLSLNTNQLKEMHCDYIISAVPVKNWPQLNLSPINTFENKNSFWRFFLYQVKP